MVLRGHESRIVSMVYTKYRENSKILMMLAGVTIIFMLIVLTDFLKRPIACLKIDEEQVKQIRSKYTYRHNRTSTKNVIAFLTPGNNYTDLASRIAQIDLHFPDKNKSDILIFHTNYPRTKDIDEVTHSTVRQVIFQNVDEYFSQFPDGFDPYLMEPNWSIKDKWSYQHMIRFWFKFVFEQPIVHSYQYLMRLDSDSRIPVLWLDLFELMREKQAVYFANNEVTDYENVLPGTMKLRDFVEDYVKQRQVQPKDPERMSKAFGNDSALAYWNNFEINEIAFFRQKSVLDWVDAIDHSWGIYKYRWGDADLRYLTLALFARKEQLLHRLDYNLEYCHPCR